MQIQLINGHFGPQEALDILTQMVYVKIQFHENKITLSDNEEDIKTRERRIKDLQRELYEARQYIEKHKPDGIGLHADVSLSVPAEVVA
ncbi:hypothetical protein GCM10023187_05200 [Nibrella viscosa]|uniref:Uncharacterized protein n=1 Tax=Nibrella viscosa TaxID=1084524 RepID=A0ABP8JWB1_9BACT